MLEIDDPDKKDIHFVLVFNVAIGNMNTNFHVLDFILHFLRNILSIEIGSVTYTFDVTRLVYVVGFPSMPTNASSAQILRVMGGVVLFLNYPAVVFVGGLGLMRAYHGGE